MFGWWCFSLFQDRIGPRGLRLLPLVGRVKGRRRLRIVPPVFRAVIADTVSMAPSSLHPGWPFGWWVGTITVSHIIVAAIRASAVDTTTSNPSSPPC